MYSIKIKRFWKSKIYVMNVLGNEDRKAKIQQGEEMFCFMIYFYSKRKKKNISKYYGS